MTPNPKCWTCQHKQPIPGDCHIRCGNPLPGMKGNPWGVANGWFFYPYNFDPIWMESECTNYTPKEANHGREGSPQGRQEEPEA